MSNKGELLRCMQILNPHNRLGCSGLKFAVRLALHPLFDIDNTSIQHKYTTQVSSFVLDNVYILARSREIELLTSELFKGVPVGTEFIDAAVHFGGTLLIIAYLAFHRGYVPLRPYPSDKSIARTHNPHNQEYAHHNSDRPRE